MPIPVIPYVPGKSGVTTRTKIIALSAQRAVQAGTATPIQIKLTTNYAQAVQAHAALKPSLMEKGAAMPIPALVGAGLGLAQKFIGGGGLGAVAGGLGYRRRRRRGLTQRQKNDIMFIKTAVGKTAAANYITLLGKG